MNPRLRLPAAVAAALLCLALLAACGTPNPETDSASAGTPPSAGSAFPVTVEHKFGSTTIPEQPQRVVTVGFNEQDFALALGVEPVGVREFLGYDAPNRPWAPEAVRGKEIPTVGANELELEQIAALEPDLILGINGYFTKGTWQKLSKIAPTLAQSDQWPA